MFEYIDMNIKWNFAIMLVKTHLKSFVLFNMYDSMLRNFEYINDIKNNNNNLYKCIISKFNDDNLSKIVKLYKKR